MEPVGRLFMDTAEMQRRGGPGVFGCFSARALHVAAMSLNRCEQRIFDYVADHPEERHYWSAKVQTVCRSEPDDATAAARLEPELWRYYLERSAVVPEFKAAAGLEGTRRTSMKNLAERLIRLWTEPRPKKKAERSEPYA